MKKLSCLLAALMLFAVAVPFSACGETPAPPTVENTQTDSGSQNGSEDDTGTTAPPESGDPEEEGPEMIEGREVIPEKEMNKFTGKYYRLLGRTYKLSKKLYLSNAGTGFEFSFYGTEVTANVYLSQGTGHYYRTYLDGDTEGTRIFVEKSGAATLATGLEEKLHTLKIIKVTSSQEGALIFSDLKTDGKFVMPEENNRLKIEFIGDSITVGAGVFAPRSEAPSYANSDATKGYAYLTAKALDLDYSLVATEGMCVKQKITFVPNMMEMYLTMSSTETLPYSFPYEHDIVVVALGTNDAYSLNAKYGQAEFTADYKELLELVRSKNRKATIVCVYGMMNTSPDIIKGIKGAIAAMDDEKISYLQLPTKTNGGGSHPSAEDAVEQSAVLTEYLTTLLAK